MLVAAVPRVCTVCVCVGGGLVKSKPRLTQPQGDVSCTSRLCLCNAVEGGGMGDLGQKPAYYFKPGTPAVHIRPPPTTAHARTRRRLWTG